MATLTLVFHGDLSNLPGARPQGRQVVQYALNRRASIKDIIESLGIPHPEIYRLILQSRDIDFDYIAANGDQIEVLPFAAPVNVFAATVLRPQPLINISFLVDVNVGKLASLLRLLGFDTAFPRQISDSRLADIAWRQNRILLTRDGNLLKRKKVVHGHLVRAIYPEEQAAEIVSLYDLARQCQPFNRCMACNGLLIPVAKEEVLPRLEPLTKKYYDEFTRCSQCAKIYWPGSHRDRMQAFLDRLQQKISQ
jgi:uncharacterized protein with PIN domain